MSNKLPCSRCYIHSEEYEKYSVNLIDDTFGLRDSGVILCGKCMVDWKKVFDAEYLPERDHFGVRDNAVRWNRIFRKWFLETCKKVTLELYRFDKPIHSQEKEGIL